MRPSSALLALLLLTGCSESVWIPAVAMPWWDTEDSVPADRMAEDCSITFHTVLLGIPSGTLQGPDGELGTLPGEQALQLVGASPTTLGEVRVPSEVPASFRFELGPPGDNAERTARLGNATGEQRAALVGAAWLGFSVTCDDTVTAEVSLAAASIECDVPEDLEVSAQNSFGTLLQFDPSAVLGDEIDGASWVAGDTNADGLLTDEERRTVVSDEDLNSRFLGALSSDVGPCR